MIYKTLPRVEYERVFFFKTANDIDEVKSVSLLRDHLSPNSRLFDQLLP
jgi:hypothetical protein